MSAFSKANAQIAHLFFSDALPNVEKQKSYFFADTPSFSTFVG